MTGQRVIRLCACGRCGGIRRTKAYTYAPDCPYAWECRRANIGKATRARFARTAAAREERRKSRQAINRESYDRRMRGCGHDGDLSHAEIDTIIAQHKARLRYLRNIGEGPELTSVECWSLTGDYLTELAPGPGDWPTTEEMARIPDPDEVRRPKRHVRQGAIPQRKAKAA